MCSDLFPSYRYMELNVRASPGYSRPDPLVPQYLINSPDWVKKHIIQRLSSSLTREDVQPLGGHDYKVKIESKADAWHTVSLGSENCHPRCTCYDWKQHKLPCKHMCLHKLRSWPNQLCCTDMVRKSDSYGIPKHIGHSDDHQNQIYINSHQAAKKLLFLK